MPRGKHIRTVAHGLWGEPTNLNNVETYASVPWIINHGAAEFASVGTETSKGTKIFSLTGKVVNGGLIEVPDGRHPARGDLRRRRGHAARPGVQGRAVGRSVGRLSAGVRSWTSRSTSRVW